MTSARTLLLLIGLASSLSAAPPYPRQLDRPKIAKQLSPPGELIANADLGAEVPQTK